MENIYLVGSEDVARAASTINGAADNMYRAANIVDNAIVNFQQQIDRLEQLLERAINELPQGQ